MRPPSSWAPVSFCASDVQQSYNATAAALLTGGFDRPYALGMALALAAKGIHLEVIGSEEIDCPEMHSSPNIRFVNLWPEVGADHSLTGKLRRLLCYYGRLLRYTSAGSPKIFHILWNNKLQTFDRTLLMLFYKACGKKVFLTAHNINQAKRDGNDSWWNRMSLRVQYRMTDHIFVHTRKMKDELMADFGISDEAITIIRHPLNDVFPDTDLTPPEARKRLSLAAHEKVILFLGRIASYKGLEYLVVAFQSLAMKDPAYRLIIAGELKKGGESYLRELRKMIDNNATGERIVQRIQHIPDSDMELYFKGCDVLVLPYKDIFQSGVLFLSYTYGLPVVATDVGSFREEIVEGVTGFICKPADPEDMAKVLQKYFSSDLFLERERRRVELRQYARRNHSWEAVAQSTSDAYAQMSGRQGS
jgi:D-inositol-3-phosphate glycosyltransferase